MMIMSFKHLPIYCRRYQPVCIQKLEYQQNHGLSPEQKQSLWIRLWLTNPSTLTRLHLE